MSKNKNSRIVPLIVCVVLCCVFTAIVVCNLTIVIKGVINPEIPPSVFGVTPMVVQSGSMSGNADDHIEVGDLIFTVKPNTDKLEKGDIISFMDGNIAVTHRIVDIQTAENGQRSFITKGDANNTEDPAVGEEAVFGLYKGRIAKLGDFAMFLQKPLGMAVFIGIPVFAFIVYDVLRRRSAARREAREKDELRSQLEKLRKDSDSAGDGSGEGGK